MAYDNDPQMADKHKLIMFTWIYTFVILIQLGVNGQDGFDDTYSNISVAMANSSNGAFRWLYNSASTPTSISWRIINPANPIPPGLLLMQYDGNTLVKNPNYQTRISRINGFNAGMALDDMLDDDYNATYSVAVLINGIDHAATQHFNRVTASDLFDGYSVRYGDIIKPNNSKISIPNGVDQIVLEFVIPNHYPYPDMIQCSSAICSCDPSGSCNVTKPTTEVHLQFSVLYGGELGLIMPTNIIRISPEELTVDVVPECTAPGAIIIVFITVFVICCIYFLVVKKALDKICEDGTDIVKTQIIKEAQKHMWLILVLAGILAIVITVIVILVVCIAKAAPADQTIILIVILVFGIGGIIALIIFGSIMHVKKLKVPEDPPTKRNLHTPTSATSASAVNASIKQKEGGHKPAYDYDADRKYLQTPDRSRRHGHLEPVTGVPQKEVDSPRRLPKPNSVSPEP